LRQSAGPISICGRGGSDRRWHTRRFRCMFCVNCFPVRPVNARISRLRVRRCIEEIPAYFWAYLRSHRCNCPGRCPVRRHESRLFARAARLGHGAKRRSSRACRLRRLLEFRAGTVSGRLAHGAKFRVAPGARHCGACRCGIADQQSPRPRFPLPGASRLRVILPIFSARRAVTRVRRGVSNSCFHLSYHRRPAR
jgi:hypothetical protein